MSMQRFGIVDIDGLWRLRMTKSDWPRFAGFDERKDVISVGEQWYRHMPGTEYLAANPVKVPALTKLIQSVPEAFDDVVFDQLVTSTTAQDPFQALSPELRIMLLDMLAPKDVANLRLCSKTFCQLPQSYFRRLIEREMPWVWELHDTRNRVPPKHGTNWFALWNRLSASDGGACLDEQERYSGGRDGSHAYDGHVEIKGLRNRRMIYRDISIILDMMGS